jgi:hypothetical protein
LQYHLTSFRTNLFQLQYKCLLFITNIKVAYSSLDLTYHPSKPQDFFYRTKIHESNLVFP